MVNKFELVDEDVGVALPCALTTDFVNEQGVCFFWLSHRWQIHL